MAREIELKLSLSPGAVSAVRRHPLLGPAQGRQRLYSVYYDTPELSLLRQGLGVRQRREGGRWLQAVKTAEPASGGLASRREWESPAQPGVFDFSVIDDAALRTLATGCQPELQALFVTDCWRTVWVVQHGAAIIEVALDRGRVIADGQSLPICEVELELCEGTLADLFAFALILQRDLPLQPMVESKAERGYRLFLKTPALPHKAGIIDLSREMNAVEAFRLIALSCLEQLQRNVPGAMAGSQPEFVHQSRVALRRLRSALHLFAPVLPGTFVAPATQGWKALAQVLGEVRDWDVFGAATLPALCRRFPDDAMLRSLGGAAEQQSAAARQRLLAVLTSREYSQLLLGFVTALHAVPAHPADLWSLAELRLRERAWRALRRARRHARLSDAGRHRMRIDFKKLRYALEFFAPLLPRKALKPYLAVLAQVQGVLGDFNDLATAGRLLQVLAAEIGAPLNPAIGPWLDHERETLAVACTDALALWIHADPPWRA